MKNVNEIIEELIKNPIYAMSLSSKELFHSNFWQWMIKEYPTFIKVFFDINEDTAIEVKREKNHTDLMIKVGKEVYIIENKFKAYPEEKQLKEYEEKLKKSGFKQGCLTYMIPPSFEETKSWKHLSYKALLEGINKQKEKMYIEEFDKSIIEKYCEMLGEIIELLSFEKSPSDNDSLSFISPKEYEEDIRLHDVYSKLLCSRFMQYYKPSQSDSIETYSIECKPDYSNQNANLTVCYRRVQHDAKKEKDKSWTEIGIQIQGNCIRHFVSISKKGHNPQKNSREIFEKFADEKWFDKEYKGNGIINLIEKEHKTNMSPSQKNEKLYNAFTGSDNIFIHQHFNIPNGYTYAQAQEYINDALDYINNHKLTSLLDTVYEKIN